MGDALLTQVPNPFYGVLPAGSPNGGPTTLEGRLLMPYPQYPVGVLQQDARLGDSIYHALQASFTKRFSHAGKFRLRIPGASLSAIRITPAPSWMDKAAQVWSRTGTT